VCDRISELKKAVASYTSTFDPSCVTTADAAHVLKQAAGIENSVRTLKALAAARAAEGDSWRKQGHRSAAEALAKDTGTTVSSAKDQIETGRRLQSQPRVSVAARRGEISFSQISMVADATEADPGAEARLVEEARRSSISKLKDACALTKAEADTDREATRRKIQERRSLRSWTDLEGVWHLSASGNPEDGAQIMAAIDPMRDRVFRAARKAGRRESFEAYGFDALLGLCKDSTGGHRGSRLARDSATGGASRSGDVRSAAGAESKILVRIDYETFLRGFPVGGETCEIAGFGPVSVAAVRDLMKMGNPFVAAVLTKGKELVGIAHLGRKPTAFQKSALEWLYPTCAVEGCNAQARLEMDHTVDWAKTRFTMLDFLKFLCHHHHRLKSNDNWALIDEGGRCLLVAPEDSRHPGHQRRSANQSHGPPKRVA
jgi:hypothetical protein